MRPYSTVLTVCAVLLGAVGCSVLQAENHGKSAPGETGEFAITPHGEDLAALTSIRWEFNFAGTFVFAGEPRAASYPNPVTRLENQAFIVAYDEQRENPAWAAYRIPGKRRFGALPRPSRFATDTRTRARVTHNNYTLTGYDRGHMVPNLAIASRFGVAAQIETFLMSNVVPQKPALNQGPWRLLEETLTETTAARCVDIWIIVGPVYDGPTRKLSSGSVIPSAFFMLVADETPQGPRLQAFILPQTAQRNANFRQFRTSVFEVQQRTGLDFYWELPDPVEARLEGQITDYWLE